MDFWVVGHIFRVDLYSNDNWIDKSKHLILPNFCLFFFFSNYPADFRIPSALGAVFLVEMSDIQNKINLKSLKTLNTIEIEPYWAFIRNSNSFFKHILKLLRFRLPWKIAHATALFWNLNGIVFAYFEYFSPITFRARYLFHCYSNKQSWAVSQ